MTCNKILRALTKQLSLYIISTILPEECSVYAVSRAFMCLTIPIFTPIGYEKPADSTKKRFVKNAHCFGRVAVLHFQHGKLESQAAYPL